MKRTHIIGGAAAILIIIIVLAYTLSTKSLFFEKERSPIGSATYLCDSGETLHVGYYSGESRPSKSADIPPTPGGSVDILFPDKKVLALKQTFAADGARYSDGDPSDNTESNIFWSKGHGSTLQISGSTTTTGCVELAEDPGDLPNVFATSTGGYSIRYPKEYTIDPLYHYQGAGPDNEIPGIKLTIPSVQTTGTNLAPDSGLSIETLPDPASCTATRFLADPRTTAIDLTDPYGVTYSIATSSDAGLGNRYEETIYARPSMTACVAVRYFIHYSVLENYPPGTIHAFDRDLLERDLNKMRVSLIIAN